MKNYKINIFTFLVAILFASCSTIHNVDTHKDSTFYKIQHIKKYLTENLNEGMDTVYVISAKKGDSLFQILSSREHPICLNCTKIKRGREYNLDLKVILRRSMGIGIGINGHKSLRGEKKYHYRVYMAKNLDGLCITQDE